MPNVTSVKSKKFVQGTHTSMISAAGTATSLNIDIGDTVFWKAKTRGHNVEFIKGGVPKGVEKFRSPLNKDTEYKFEIPGIYAYWCTPHKGMGMIGFVIVGNDKSNLDDIKKIKYIGKSKKIAEELINSL